MIFLNHIEKYIFLISFTELVKSVFWRGEPRLSIVSISSKGSVSSRATSISRLSNVSSLNSIRSRGPSIHKGSTSLRSRNSQSNSRQNSRRGSDVSSGSNVALTHHEYRKGRTWFSRLKSRLRIKKGGFSKSGYSKNGKKKL